MSGSNATSSAARQKRPVSVPSLFFNHWRDTFDRLGWRDAADNLNRYLGGTGAEKSILREADRADAAGHAPDRPEQHTF